MPAKIIGTLGLEKVMFEAADPEVFTWYIKNYGPEVNLFVDHSQIVQLECVRSGIWGTADVWGRDFDVQSRRGEPMTTEDAEARIDYQESSAPSDPGPVDRGAISRGCKLEPPLLELVKLRASMINGCAYCVDMH